MNIYVNENTKVNNLGNNVSNNVNNNSNNNVGNAGNNRTNAHIYSGASKNIFNTSLNGIFEKSDEKYSLDNTYGKDSHIDDENRTSDKTANINMDEMIASLDEMITPESYDQMETLGIIPDDEEPELTVGVSRRIQMELAAYCDDYEVPGFNFDSKQLEKVLGSKGFAESVKKAVDVYNMPDSAKSSIVNGTDNLLVDDAYKAAYSAGSSTSYMTNKQNTGNTNNDTELSESINNQVINKFNEWGVENNKKNLELANQMINQGVAFTMDNFVNYSNLDAAMSMDATSYENMVSENISKTMYLTGSASTAQIAGVQYDEDEINEAVKTISEATDREVYDIIDNNKILNIKNLEIEKEKRAVKEAEEQILEQSAKIEKENQAAGQAAELSKDELSKEELSNTKFIAAKKVIVTARAVMQFSSVARVKSMGIDIKYKDLSDLIDIIMKGERDYATSFLKSANAEVTQTNISTFSMTVSAVYEIEKSAVAMIPGVNVEESLEVVSSYASKFSAQYTSVVASYEAVGTEVRRDLGDSISKAFENIDELLSGIGLEINEANSRAVRILGYNNMSITTDNVNMVKEKAEQIDYLVENLTPKTVSYLIANDINPMKENIVDLNKKLEKINEDNGYNAEDFAKYLWNLGKSGNISEVDRQKFIDMYRSIKRITKMDMRSIGAAIRSEYDFSMESLETSYMNRNYAGNSEFTSDNKGYEEFKQSLAKGEYTSEAEIDMLLSNNVKPTLSNIKNTKKLMKQGAKVMEKLMNTANSDLLETVNSILESNDETELADKFKKLEDIGAKTVKDMVSGGFSLYTDMENALENNRVLKLMNNFARSNSYFVPVNMNGSWTSIHLTIKNGTNTSTMLLETTTVAYGEVHLSVSAHSNDEGNATLKGMLAYSEDKLGNIEQLKDEFLSRLTDAGISVSEMTIANTSTYSEKINVEENVQMESNVLYQTAKIFISTISYYEK